MSIPLHRDVYLDVRVPLGKVYDLVLQKLPASQRAKR